MVSHQKRAIYVISLVYAITLGLGKVIRPNSQRQNFGIGSPEGLPYSGSPWSQKLCQPLYRAVTAMAESANHLEHVAHAGMHIGHMHI